MSTLNVQKTFGALLLGAVAAILFSGVVSAQSFVYYKMYPKDRFGVKLLVFVVWFLDFGHTIFITISLWDHLILHFGDAARIDFVPWSLALTIAFTAILTFLVHLFFIFRIFKLSKGSFIIAIPLTLIACTRLTFACLTTAKLISLKSLEVFVELFTWSFTTGLSLSALLDVLITGLLCFLLQKNKESHSNMNHVLDTLILYTFECGALTCASAVATLICWLTSNKNLIFMGLHFFISKSYANSLLATLNTRGDLRTRRHTRSDQWDKSLAFKFASTFALSRREEPEDRTRTTDLRDLTSHGDSHFHPIATAGPSEIKASAAVPDLDSK